MTAPSVLGAARHEALLRTTEVISELGDAEKVERARRERGQVEANFSYITAAMLEALAEIVADQEARISELEGQLLATTK
jgi:hypothetical protein